MLISFEPKTTQRSITINETIQFYIASILIFTKLYRQIFEKTLNIIKIYNLIENKKSINLAIHNLKLRIQTY